MIDEKLNNWYLKVSPQGRAFSEENEELRPLGRVPSLLIDYVGCSKTN